MKTRFLQHMFGTKSYGLSCYQHFSCNPASKNNLSLKVCEYLFSRISCNVISKHLPRCFPTKSFEKYKKVQKNTQELEFPFKSSLLVHLV